MKLSINGDVTNSISEYDVFDFEFCLDKTSGRHSIFYKTWNGGASSNPALHFSLYDITTKRFVSESILDIANNSAADLGMAQCLPGEETWIEGGFNDENKNITHPAKFTPCRCSISHTGSIGRLSAEINGLLSRTDRTVVNFPGNIHKVEPVIIYESTKLSDLLAAARRIGVNNPFSIYALETGTKDLIFIKYDDPGYLGSYQHVLIKDFERPKRFALLYSVQANSKTFHKVEPVTGTANRTKPFQDVVVEMCTKDCDWWGNRERVRLDLNALTLTKLPAS